MYKRNKVSIKLFLLFLLFFKVFSFETAKAAAISPIETQIKHNIASYRQEQLSLLEKLVNINSGTTNIEGVHQVGEMLRPYFEELGFKTYWVEEPAEMNRAGTLIAERQGSKGKRLLLIGHLDTVFPKTSSFQKFERHGNFATGPGVIDDKGGDIVILYALKALFKAHVLADRTITVVLTGDEEDSGKPTAISRKPLFLVAKNSNVALDFEWGITSDTATIARRGISNWEITAQGKGLHSSGIFQKVAGDGAIFELTRILNSMRIQLGSEKYLSFSPGIILGGTTLNYNKNSSEGGASGKTNVIAKIASAKGDIRFLTSGQKINAEKRISSIVSQSLPGTTAAILFQDGIPSMAPTLANQKLLEKYSKASIGLGYGAIKPLDPGLRGAADISHIASIVKANLAGLGPIGMGAHSENETLDIASFTMQTQRAALLIYQLTR